MYLSLKQIKAVSSNGIDGKRLFIPKDLLEAWKKHNYRGKLYFELDSGGVDGTPQWEALRIQLD